MNFIELIIICRDTNSLRSDRQEFQNLLLNYCHKLLSSFLKLLLHEGAVFFSDENEDNVDPEEIKFFVCCRYFNLLKFRNDFICISYSA